MSFSKYASDRYNQVPNLSEVSASDIDPQLHSIYFKQLELSADWHDQMVNDSAARGERVRMRNILKIIKKHYEMLGLPTENLDDAEDELNQREFDKRKFKILIQVAKMFSTPKSQKRLKTWVNPNKI